VHQLQKKRLKNRYNRSSQISSNQNYSINPKQTQIPPDCQNTQNLQFLPEYDASLDSLPVSEAVTEYTNRLRDNMNIPRLKTDPKLTYIASFKASEMAREQYYAHTNPITHETAFDLAKRLGYSSNCGMAENIHYTPSTAYQVFLDWFCSPGHFRNMTNPTYTVTGVGFAQGTAYETAPNGFIFPNNKWSVYFGC